MREGCGWCGGDSLSSQEAAGQSMLKTLLSVSLDFQAVDHKRLPGSPRRGEKKNKNECGKRENLFKVPAWTEQQEELLYQGVP